MVMNGDNRRPIVPRRQKCWSVRSQSDCFLTEEVLKLRSQSVFDCSPAAEMLERTVTFGLFPNERNVREYGHDWVLISIFQKKFRGKVRVAGFAYIQIKMILNIYFGFSFLIS